MFEFDIVSVENPCMVPVCKEHWRLYFKNGVILRLGYRCDPTIERAGESE